MPRDRKFYTDYLQSKQWRKKRMEVLVSDGHRCTKCRSRKNLHVHHLTYDRLGDENLEDLTTLCASCHEKIHKIKKRKTAKKPKNEQVEKNFPTLTDDQIFALERRQIEANRAARSKTRSERGQKNAVYAAKRKERAADMRANGRKPDISSPFRFL